jgi:FlaA1/EpsC-like NDP-sugar epimerase
MVLAFYGRLSLNRLIELTALTFPIQQYIGHFIFGSILFLALSARMGNYSANNVLKLRQIFIAEMNTAVLWASCFLFLSLLFSFQPPISRIFVILSAILGLALVLGWRWLLRWIIEKQGITQKLRKRLVIVGWNVEATKLAEAIRRDSSHPYEIIGCLPSAFNEYRIQPPPEIRKLGEYNSIIDIHNRKPSTSSSSEISIPTPAKSSPSANSASAK